MFNYFQHKLIEAIQKHPVLCHNPPVTLTLDEERRLANRQIQALKSIDLVSWDSFMKDVRRLPVATRVTMLVATVASLKEGAAFGLFVSSVRNMGTERHQQILKDAIERKVGIVEL